METLSGVAILTVHCGPPFQFESDLKAKDSLPCEPIGNKSCFCCREVGRGDMGAGRGVEKWLFISGSSYLEVSTKTEKCF